MDDNSFSEESNENKGEEIYDSLNNAKKSDNKEIDKNLNNISINSDDSALQKNFESLSKIPKNNPKEEDNIKENINQNYSIDNDNNKIPIDKVEDIKDIKINNDEENVNLGNSFSKISERDKLNNNINDNEYNTENNNIEENKNNEVNKNLEVVTPNTSIYNLSETVTKKSGQEINNIEITNKNINNNININENKEELQNTNNLKKKESFNIFDDDSLIYNKKGNLSATNNSINPNEEENKLLYNINFQFSKIGKPNENENDLNNNNFEDEIINLTDKNIKNNNRNKKTKNAILKRFEQIKKNKIQNINIEPLNSIKTHSENNTNNLIYEEQNNNKISQNYMTNSSNENNFIYLCPFCNKETPEIIKIEGIQNNIKNPTIDKISISCSCGSYKLNLDEFITKIEYQNEYKMLKDFCYNENHNATKGVCFCSKCDKWFCQQCLLYHRSLLPDHLVTPTKITKYLKCKNHSNEIIFFCTKCNIGICEKCKSEFHYDHYLLGMEEYFNETYKSLPFKTFDELNEFIEHCNRISEKGKNSYINYIDDMIKKLNQLKNDIQENYEKSKKRRIIQQKLVKYLFGNFICFNENFRQIHNMNSINFICPSLFLYNDINFLKTSNLYSLYLRKESFIEINQDKKLEKAELNNIFEKYSLLKKEKDTVQNGKNDYNGNKLYLNTIQSETNSVYPTLFKIYNNTGIYYGEIDNNKRNGIGKQFNNKNEYEGIWNNGDIIKGKAVFYSDQGNIIYEGEFKDGVENGYGEKIYPNKRVYKGNFINGKIDTKYEIQKKLEINSII